MQIRTGAVKRQAGVLLHLSSIPTDQAIGDLGQDARNWIDLIADHHITAWQVLPIGPTSEHHSPYEPLSAFAGNPLFIDIPQLVVDKLLKQSDLEALPPHDIPVTIDFLLEIKHRLLRAAHTNFIKTERPPALHRQYGEFIALHRQWLDDWSIFAALTDHFQTPNWHSWPDPLKTREPQALSSITQQLAPECAYHRFVQFIFFDQWLKLKRYANHRQVEIIGDLPIYVAKNSVDVWSRPDHYKLSADLSPEFVAGVPPDYFSNTGQRWGNPVYQWSAHRHTDFRWWISRFKHSCRLFDSLRIDHFRGFVAYWEIPAKYKTAKHGRWNKAPGQALFNQLKKKMGNIPFFVEDLGHITKAVQRLRDHFHFPSMKVMQFGFNHPTNLRNKHLPHHCQPHHVLYTGTHDNNTCMGFYHQNANALEKKFMLSYLNVGSQPLHWAFINAALNSRASLVIIPLQDILGLGSEARMNIPGKAHGNWRWELSPQEIDRNAFNQLGEMIVATHRTTIRAGP